MPWCLSLFKIHSSSDAPRNEFAGGERGDNRGTKCPDPKALLDGIQQRFFICVHGFPSMVHRPARSSCRAPAFAPPLFRASRRPFVFSCSGCSFADSALLRACRPGLPGWRARNASVTLSFRRPRGRRKLSVTDAFRARQPGKPGRHARNSALSANEQPEQEKTKGRREARKRGGANAGARQDDRAGRCTIEGNPCTQMKKRCWIPSNSALGSGHFVPRLSPRSPPANSFRGASELE